MRFLHDLLTEQTLKAPKAIAAIFGESRATYEELDERASRIASALRDHGIILGDRVGLQLSRSLDLIPALVGLLRAGAVCVPIDPEDPADRRAVIVAQSGARVVVTDKSLKEDAGSANIKFLAVEDLLDHGQRWGGGVALPEDALAFVFYTSGSTGVPKGVQLTHRSLLSGQEWLNRTFPLDPGDRQLLRTTLSVTNIVREVFWPFLHGGTIVIVPPGAHKDADRLVHEINRNAVNTLVVVPALLKGMLENRELGSNKSLKYVFCSSDAMASDVADKYFDQGPDARLFNLYGLTEALYACYWECFPRASYNGLVPVGLGAELVPSILDGSYSSDGSETGELCLAGVGLADGYDQLPELTSERFPTLRSGRVFRTGDLARRSTDGKIELLGRMDDQVKISGHRVELGEVESHLRDVPGVIAAVVTGHRGVGGHLRLAAYLVCGSETPTAAELRESLAEQVPDYMIPASYIVIDQIPYTHNGKVDRWGLQDLPGLRLESTEAYVPPRTDLEEYLCGLWSSVLEIPKIGTRDNFFTLGGDSIQGFLVSARANRDGIPLTAVQIFQTPTIAETAEYVETKRTEAPVIKMERRDRSGEALQEVKQLASASATAQTAYPLTEMQKGMLFHSLLDPDSGVYFEQFLYTISGDLDSEEYNRAWQRVVDRHEILRVWIAMEGLNEPLQVVNESASLEWTYLDWAHLNAAAQSIEVESYLRKDRYRGFVYEEAPLFRLTLIRLGTTSFKLVMSYHHLILDAWSLFVLLRDSLEIYHSSLEGTEPTLNPSMSFGDYVSYLELEDVDAARAYWDERLSEFRQATVIGRSPRLGLSASPQDMHAEARLDLGVTLSERLLKFGRDNQLTLNTLVQGAWAIVVGSFSGKSDVAFGVTITHRPVGLNGVEDGVGIFINSLPMRISIDSGLEVGSWLQGVQRTQVQARAHDHYPLPLIQERTDLPSGEPLFESLLIFENFPRGTGWSGRGGLDVKQERYVGWTNYPFAIEAMPEEQLFFQVKYDLKYFDATLVQSILGAFRTVLTLIADGANQTLGTLISDIACDAPSSRNETPQDNMAVFPSRGTAQAEPIRAIAETKDEIELASVWEAVLGVDRIDVELPFLALGGSSLAAMRVLSLAREKGIEISLRDLFSPTGTVREITSRR